MGFKNAEEFGERLKEILRKANEALIEESEGKEELRNISISFDSDRINTEYGINDNGFLIFDYDITLPYKVADLETIRYSVNDTEVNIYFYLKNGDEIRMQYCEGGSDTSLYYTYKNFEYNESISRYILESLFYDNYVDLTKEFLIDREGTLVRCHYEEGQEVIIPEGVRGIAPDAFLGGNKSYDVICPDSLEVIYSRAFWNSKIKSIGLGKGIETIGREAFYRCDELKSITLPPSLKYCVNDAFMGSGIKDYSQIINNSEVDITKFEF